MNTQEYTLIAYKPASCESYRGEVYRSWDAEHEVHSNIEERELIRLCTNYYSVSRDQYEAGFTFTVCTVIDGQLHTFDGFLDHHIENDKMNNIAHAIIRDSKKIIEARNAAIMAEEAAKVDKENQYKIARDLAELARLSQLYPKT